MKTNRPAFSIRNIIFVCLLLVLALPQFVFSEAGTYQGMWPPLPNKWYLNAPKNVAIAKGSGNIYVADTGHHRIMKFKPDGSFITSWGGLASGSAFIGYGDGFIEPGAIAIDASENIYVADVTMCKVQKFDKDGNFLTKWGQFGMSDPQFDMARPQGIAINSQGHVYVTQSGSASILVYDSEGNYVSTIDNGYGTANGQFRTPWAIAFDSLDNFYVTELDGNRVQKFASDGTYITKWNFSSPDALVVDSDDNIYVGNYFDNYISKFDSSGNLITSWAVDGSFSVQSNGLSGFSLDSAGNFYVADPGNNRIQKYAADRTLIATWEAKSSANGKFAYPNAVAVDASGNIYVADTGNNRIQKFNSSKVYVTQWGTYGTENGQLDNPKAIAVDAAGNVYVADTGSGQYNFGRIQKFSSTGTFISSWQEEYLFQGNPKPFKHPSGIAVFGNNVYVADTDNHRILQFDLTGKFIATGGIHGGGKSELNMPAALATDKVGNVYIVDAGNSCVKMMLGNTDQAANLLDQWYPVGWPDGGGGVLGADGTGDGQFRAPTGIVVDGAGNIYVADSLSRIQMFDAAGTFLKEWGTAGSDDGQFYGPAGMAIKTNGSIYVVDNDNSRIQYFTSTAVDVTPPVVTFTVPASVSALTITFTAFSATDDGVVSGYMITESATAPLASSSDWLSEAPTTYTFNTSGAKTLYGWAKDAAGNVSLGKKATTSCTADTTSPVVTVFTVPTASKTLPVSPIVITATDAVGVTAYMITESNATPPQKDDSGWLTTKPTSYTFADGTGDGTKTLYAWAKDAAGNVSAGKLARITIATTAPVVSDFTVPSTSKTLAVTGISITTTGTGTLGYMITASATAPLATATTWLTTKPTSYTFASGTTEGTKTLYAWAKDAAGNVSTAKTATVALDITKPVVVTFTVTTPVNALTVPVTALTATDSIGVTGYLITETATVPAASADGWSSNAPDSYTASAATVKMLYAWAKDAAGNVSAAKTAVVAIDTAAPTISAFTVPAYTSKTAITVKITATDNVKATGFQISESDTAPDTWLLIAPTTYTITATTEGKVKIYAWVKDAAGNTASKFVEVFYDKTAPTVDTFTVDANVPAAIPIKAFEASDTDGSGIAGYMVTATATPPLATATTWSATAPTTFTNTVAGQKTIYAWVKDKAGNVSAAKTATVTADVVLPVVTVFTVQATVVKEFKVPITALTATDLSGISAYLVTETATIPALSDAGWNATAPADYTFTSTGAKKLYGWAKDTVGNISKAKIVSVTIDQTAPVVSTLTVPVAYNNLIMPVTALKGTDNVAVTGYLITESATAPDPAATTWTATAPKSYTFSSIGKKTIYAWLKDSMGYVSAAKSAEVQIDTTKPTVDSFSADASVKGLVVQVTAFTGSDETDGSGIGGYKITETATVPLATATGWTATAPASYTTKTTVAKTLYAWTKDKAGNVSAAKTASVTFTP